MAKTALDIKRDQWLAYDLAAAVRRRQASGDPEARKRWKRAQEVVRKAARRLRAEFGAHRVVLFGSAVDESSFTLWSDIDLAVWGVPPERFYGAVASVTSLCTDIPVDLVDGGACSKGLTAVIQQEGVEL